jgi:PAS domain-containing protein
MNPTILFGAFSGSLNQVPDGFFSVDTESNFHYWEESFYGMLFFQNPERIGLPCAFLF